VRSTVNGVDSVTVIMATYNAMPYLREAVESIQAQRFTSWRLLIVDDASSDGSRGHLERVNDRRVQIVRLSANSGQGVARNIALAQCETPYVAVMDADDVSHPDRLGAQVAFLQANPSVGTVGTQFTYLGGSGRTGFGSLLPCEHAEIFDNLLNGRHAIVNGSVCCRTSLLKECGGFGVVRAGEDWDIYLRMGMRARLANLADRLYLYRIHPLSTTVTKLADVRLQYGFAAYNARRRLQGLPEAALETYQLGLQGRALIARLSRRRELAALAVYRAAISNILHGHQVRGYPQLAAAALLAPDTARRRVIRMIRFLTSRPKTTWVPSTGLSN
jgi:glycosyltransferase involved in cell wall biosynthesis